MRLIAPTVAASVLGATLTPEDLAVAEATSGECGLDAIEHAAIARAVERWPRALDEPGATLHSRHAAERVLLVWTDHPDAGPRHVCAGALVWALCGPDGFRYGAPLPLRLDDPLRMYDAAETRALEEAAQRAEAAGKRPPPLGRYEAAEQVVRAFLGVRWLDDADGPEGPDPRTPERIYTAAIDLAIDLLCDPRHIAEVTAGAAAWLLRYSRERSDELAQAWPAERARRMLAVVGRWGPR